MAVAGGGHDKDWVVLVVHISVKAIGVFGAIGLMVWRPEAVVVPDSLPLDKTTLEAEIGFTAVVPIVFPIVAVAEKSAVIKI